MTCSVYHLPVDMVHFPGFGGQENYIIKSNVTAPVFYMFCYGQRLLVIQTDKLMVFPHPHLKGMSSSSNVKQSHSQATYIPIYMASHSRGQLLVLFYAFIIITDDLEVHASNFLSKAYNTQSMYFIFGAIKMCLWLCFPNGYKWNVGTSNVQRTVSLSECLPSTFWSNTIFCSIISNAIFAGDI